MFHPDDLCQMTGLKSKPEWNGKKARIVGSFQWHQARYPVQVLSDGDDDEKALDAAHSALLKPANLKILKRHDHSKQDIDPLFEVKRIDKEHGFGMFAVNDIPSGTLILRESPIITLLKEEHRTEQTEEQWIHSQFEALSKGDQDTVLSLHNNLEHDENTEGKTRCVGVYRTNAYCFTDHDRFESGLFPMISRINHSCFPNAQFVDDTKHEMHGIIALCGISAGEEITHCYIDIDLFMADSMKRQKYILEHYGFECQCRDCVLFKKRDKFRRKYREFEEGMDKAFELEQLDKDRILECALGMVDVVKDHFNGYPPLLSAAYMKVAEAKLMEKRYEEVLKYMKISAKLDRRYYGDGCEMRDIVQCRERLPIKYRDTFPWDHVFGLEV